MLKYYTPSSWFWILMAFLLCCLITFSQQKNDGLRSAVQQASSSLISIFR